MKEDFYFVGKNVVLLAQRLETPFFLFDQVQVEKNFNLLKSSFSSGYKNLRIDYSAKTNLELGILKILKKLGVCLEIACLHELEVGKRAGFSPWEMILDTPVKKEEEIEIMIKEAIHALYADSLDDVKRLQMVAGKMKKVVNVVARINPGFPLAILNPAERFLEKFGTLENELSKVVKFILGQCPNLRIIGLSVHVGSQQLTPAAHLRALRKIFHLAMNLEKKGVKIEELCVGGGYPSLTLNKKTLFSLIFSFLGITIQQKACPVEEFGKQISQAFAQEVKTLKSKPILVIQPGRSLISNTAIAVGRIMVVKGDWVFTDLSTSSLPESLFFGQRKVILANKYKKLPEGKYNIAGRGLNTADNLAISQALPKPKVGDILVVFDAGAYSISRANRFTVLNPPVYLVTRAGKIKLIRRQETYEDILAPMEA